MLTDGSSTFSLAAFVGSEGTRRENYPFGSIFGVFSVSKGKYFQNQLLKHGAERSKLLKLQPGRVCLTQKRICIY